MRICLVSSEHSPWGGIGHTHRRLADLLATRHEVTVIQAGIPLQREASALTGVREVSAEPRAELGRMAFSCESHRQSAAVLEAIERAYASDGPDYVEVADYHASGLVPMQARQSGHRLLRDTLFGVRLSGTVELVAVHDGTLRQPGIELVAALERAQLQMADRLLWRGGDTLDLYRRYYSDLDLPEATLVRPPFEQPLSPPAPAPRDPTMPLKILYVGRLQRFKGTLDLVEACMGLTSDDWMLTMIGADTDTAPAGQSVRMTIETMCGDDPRVGLEGPIPHQELQHIWAQHDVLVVPSTFEVWGNVAVEAMRAGLPVLASPVGGPAEIVVPGVTGWLTDGLGPDALRRSLDHLLGNRDELERIRASGAVFERFRNLTDPDEVHAGYDRLLGAERGTREKRVRQPDHSLVTGIIPYYHSAAYVEEAVDSLLGQSHSNVDVLIVNDGSFEEEDEILIRLARSPRVQVVTQLNRGEPAARNLGAMLARGRYLAMLDADNILEEDFVARAVAMLQEDPSLPYVTCWLRFIVADGSGFESGGYAPLGNSVVSDDSNESNNWDGDAIAVFPGGLFSALGYRYEQTAGMQSDWELYRRLREDGRFGAVIPERLARCRVYPDSLSTSHEEELHQRARGEARTRRRLRSIRWTSESMNDD